MRKTPGRQTGRPQFLDKKKWNLEVSYIANIKPERKSILGLSGKTPSSKVFSNWVRHAEAGDFARVIFAPTPFEKMYYGQPISPGKLFWIERLLGGGDVTLIKSWRQVHAIINGETFCRFGRNGT